MAKGNVRVLKDPEPQVFFLQYGASTLDFELRIFVNSLTDRLYAADEINVEIAARFQEHGVEIAFNQLDVRLHDAKGGPIEWGAPAVRERQADRQDDSDKTRTSQAEGSPRRGKQDRGTLDDGPEDEG